VGDVSKEFDLSWNSPSAYPTSLSLTALQHSSSPWRNGLSLAR
jgi:hypothetical protein